MGREVGEGIRMGNTCKSMADSCQCMAKTSTIKKKKEKKEKKFNQKKPEEYRQSCVLKEI